MPAAFALKFISGKYQGGEFPLPERGELILGRTSEADMVLVEDMVSRKHARIVVDGNRMGIIDLSSTNGTFVNGEKVSKLELKIGDRILVGTNILRVVGRGDVDAKNAALGATELRSMMEEIAQTRRGDTTMSGDLSEVPFPDIMQLFSSSKKSGVLDITGDVTATVILKSGKTVAVTVGDKQFAAIKGFARLVRAQKGRFELKALTDTKFDQIEGESTESLLLEGLRQLDEAGRVLNKMPPLSARLHLARPCKAKLKELKPEQLDWLQLFLENDRFSTAMDAFEGTDFAVMHGLHDLLDKGILSFAP